MNYSGGGTGPVSSSLSSKVVKAGVNGRSQLSELVASSPSQRNWRGIGIALLVILIVCSLIVTAVVLLSPGDSGPRIRGEPFTLDDVLSEAFTASSFNGTWISETEFVYRSADGRLLLYDADTQNVTKFVSSEPFSITHAQLWSLSPDRRFLLLVSGMHKVFRYSYLAVYNIYEIIGPGEYKPVGTLGPDSSRTDRLQYASWGPEGNSLVFVFQNNVFYKASATSDSVKQLTGSKLEEAVINGVPDWVYEEEILSSNSALWFSKTGKFLCFASFNDTFVPVQHFEWFGNPQQQLLYPQPDIIRYPKPGTQNPTVRLLVVNLTELGPDEIILEHVIVPPPVILEEEDHYFTAVSWISDTDLSVTWMNRRQNLSIITICSPPLWFCNESYREDMKQLGWVDWYEPPLFISGGRRYLFRGATEYDKEGYFRQILVKNVDEHSAKKLHPLTMAKWEIVKINAYDEANGMIYFTAAPEKRAGERHLYRISDVPNNNPNTTGYCMTCHLEPDCLYNKVYFSPGAKYYVLDCQGTVVPRRFLYETESNKQLDVLENNDALRELIATKALPQIRTFRVALDGGYEASVRLLLPPGLRDDEITQYPLVVNVYGGPGSQLVSEKFEIDWGTYLSSNMSYIYGTIDGRGSGFQGEKRKFELYRRLGTVEVEDQIAVTKLTAIDGGMFSYRTRDVSISHVSIWKHALEYLKENLQFVDKLRVAIWGWSYGGFVTARVLATDSEVFRCGISVAPVTNWKYYDSVYTERYMGFPTAADNEEGYVRADVVKLANNFKDKRFYLIHGTADDNVHLQQSMLLSSALAHANVMFRAQVYPDENHALYGVQKHLYNSMTDFLEECFRIDKMEEIEFQKQESIKDDQGE